MGVQCELAPENPTEYCDLEPGDEDRGPHRPAQDAAVAAGTQDTASLLQ